MKYRVYRNGTYLAFFASATMLSSCVPAFEGVTTIIQLPPNYPQTQGVNERLAILEIKGDRSGGMESALTSIMTNYQYNGKTYFTLVDRSNLDKITSEVAKGQSGLIDDRSAAQVGKLAGAKAILVGAYSSSSSDERYQESRYDYKSKTDYKVGCTRRLIQIDLGIRIIEVDTGKVVYAQQIPNLSTSSKCDDKDYGALDNPITKIPSLNTAISYAIIRDIAPHTASLNISFINTPKEVKNEAARILFSRAIDWAKTGRLDRACPDWIQSNETEPNNPVIVYHLGICAEAQGDVISSEAIYNKADKLTNAPNTVISAALQRITSKRSSEQFVKITGSSTFSDALDKVKKAFGSNG